MNINAKKAQDKLSQELSAAKLGKYAQAVAKPTLEALKTFAECAENAVKGVRESISDIEVYRRAVSFYFKGADVHFNMTIDLGDGSDSEETAKPPVSLSLDGLLDF